MARTVIDVDDKMLTEAAEIFGTTTKVATVIAALQDAIKRRKRESFLNWLAEGGLPDLTGPVDASADPHQAASQTATSPTVPPNSECFHPGGPGETPYAALSPR